MPSPGRMKSVRIGAMRLLFLFDKRSKLVYFWFEVQRPTSKVQGVGFEVRGLRTNRLLYPYFSLRARWCIGWC